MKKINLLSLLSVITLFSYACHNNQDDPTKYVDKPIKEVTTYSDGGKAETTYEYDEQYRKSKVEIKNIDTEGTVTDDYIHKYTYNDHGYIATYVLTDNGEEEMNITISYEYDDNGNITKETEIGTDNQENTYVYDSLNRLTERKYYNHDDTNEDSDEWDEKYVYTYETNFKEYNKLEHYEKTTSQDDPHDYETQKLDGKGRIIEHVYYLLDDFVEKCTSYQYNDYDCLTHYERICGDGSDEKYIVNTTYYKNNPDKILTSKEEEFDLTTSEVVATITTTNEYDTHDRIKKETFNDNGDITTTEYFYEFE